MSAFLLLGAACSTPTDTAPTPKYTPVGECRDRDCPPGEECVGTGCVPVRPTLYPHIQLASALLRDYVDFTEIDWRAEHYDLLIGRTATYGDRLRAGNPNVRLFDYALFLYNFFAEHAEEWAALNDYDYEDFFLHYLEDVNVPGYESTILVPGYAAGFVPGWNPEPGPDAGPATAASRDESRVFGLPHPNHDPWHLANINDEGYRRFLVDLMERLMDGSLYGAANFSGPVDGIMVDVGVFYPQFNEGLLGHTAEYFGIPLDYSHPYAEGFVDFYTELADELNDRIPQGVDLMPNYGNASFLNRPDPLSQGTLEVVDWVWAEVWVMYRGYHIPNSGPTRVISYDKDYDAAVANIVRQTRAGGRRVLGARDVARTPNPSDRGRLYTLALYYLVHNPNTFYLYECFNGHYYQPPLSEWQWNPAVEYDIGEPAPVPEGFVDFDGVAGTNEHFELASGPDPYDSSLTYHLLARMFTDGMVIVKMLPEGSVVDEQSTTTHTLDRPYKILSPDGTVGETAVTQVSIKNNEGIILVLP
jgi:hypothetical protein